MLCKKSLDKISLGKKYFSQLVFGVRWQDFLLSSDPFSFEGNESELHFYEMPVIRTLGTVILAAIFLKFAN